jgi:hypothetical protein
VQPPGECNPLPQPLLPPQIVQGLIAASRAMDIEGPGEDGGPLPAGTCSATRRRHDLREHPERPIALEGFMDVSGQPAAGSTLLEERPRPRVLFAPGIRHVGG